MITSATKNILPRVLVPSHLAVPFFRYHFSRGALATYSRTVTVPKSIEANTTKLGEYLEIHNLPRPSSSAAIASHPKSSMTTSRIVTLAKSIEANTTKLDAYLEEHSLPRPSFDEDAPLMYQLPPDIAAAQEALTADLDELYWLNQGPIQTVVAKSVRSGLNCLSMIMSSDLDSLLRRSVSGRPSVITSNLSFHSSQVQPFKSLRKRQGFR